MTKYHLQQVRRNIYKLKTCKRAVLMIATGRFSFSRGIDKTLSIHLVQGAPGGHWDHLASRDHSLLSPDPTTISHFTSIGVQIRTGTISCGSLFPHPFRFSSHLYYCSQSLLELWKMTCANMEGLGKLDDGRYRAWSITRTPFSMKERLLSPETDF